MPLLRRLALFVVLIAGPASAQPAYRPDVQKAIDLFTRAEDERAQALFRKALKKALPIPEAALCHVYLGLIALNAVDADRARSEFHLALSIDPHADLPKAVTPKARESFQSVQEEMGLQLAAPTVEATPPVAAPQPTVTPAPLVLEAAQPPPEGPPLGEGRESGHALRTVGYSTAAVGGAVLLTGIGCFIAASLAASGAQSATDEATAVIMSNRYAKLEYAGEWFASVGATVVGIGVAAWLVDYALAPSAPKPVARAAVTGLQLVSDGLRF